MEPAVGREHIRRRSRTVPATTIELESVLRSGRVAVLGLELSASFFQPQVPWIISATTTTHGLHAVLGVGLGSFQTGRVVLVRNSWGVSWADSGHAWLDQSYMNRHLRAILVLAEEVPSVMTVFVEQTRLAAWLAATEHLLSAGPSLNIVLSIASPAANGPSSKQARAAVDRFLASENQAPLHTVAETIFPAWEYRKRGLAGVFEKYPAEYDIFKRGDGGR